MRNSNIIRSGLIGSVLTVLLVTGGLFLPGCTPSSARIAGDGPDRLLGFRANIGEGTVVSYAEIDAEGKPTSIGVAFSESAMATLPTTHTDGHHCYDHNGDGKLDKGSECLMTHEWVLPLPSDLALNDDVPFKWVLLNWNPGGHVPPGVFDKPHFDVHFYIESIENIFSIASGTCGPEFVRCDQFEIGQKPVPSNYMHPDFKDVGAVVPAMGNHLIDVTAPEFEGVPFTRTWVYGLYDGKITFYEEMLTSEFMLSKPSTCFEIKRVPAVGLSGFYPTKSCTRFDAEAELYTVSMEEFEYRYASPPAAAMATEGE